MKVSNILAAAIVGTSFMTLYSYIISKKEKDEFVEPVLINELIDGSETLPDIAEDEKEAHPAGWFAHYGIGVAFVFAYYILWRRSLTSPGIIKGLLLGSVSGLIGIVSWEIMFSANDDPPHNDRSKYYRQLFIAHLIFSVTSVYGYKLPDAIRQLKQA
jgi:hypothetical protein